MAGPLNFCLCIIRWAPVLFITAVVVWSYYAYVIQMCLFTIDSIPEKVLYLVFYHPILFLFGWSYWQTTFTNPGKPTSEFYLSHQDADRYSGEENEDAQRQILAQHGRRCPVQCRTSSGDYRFCEKCKCIKPDRAHHCSVCGACVLKMDHHCPWVNNCVNFTNYKFFVLFLGYALIYCIYVAATSLQYFIKFWSGEAGDGMGKFHVLFLFFASVMFAISLISLFGYHIYLTCLNRSTLESFRAPIFRTGPDKDGFSLGRYSNFIEIFGEDKRYWFLPLFTSPGDGITFPIRVITQDGNSYQSMDHNHINSPLHSDPENPPSPKSPRQEQSFGDGINYPIRSVDEDYDSLLGHRQRWMEEADESGPETYIMEPTAQDRTATINYNTYD